MKKILQRWCYKNTFNSGLHSDAYELISFKGGMTVDMNKQFDTSLNDLDFHSKSQGLRKLKLTESQYWCVEWSSPNFCNGSLCKEDDCKDILRHGN